MTAFTREAALEHYGVKGMRWGFRKSTSSGSTTSRPMSTKKKVAIGVAAATTVAGGIYVARVMSSKGKLPVQEIIGTANKLTVTNKYGTSTYGSEAVKAFDRAKLVSDVPSYVAAQQKAAEAGRVWVASADASHWKSRPLTDIYSPEMIRKLYG